jgi:Flp pilus assembly protein TadG
MMSTMNNENGKTRSIFRDRRGNFGIMSAIMMPVMIAGAGVAVDTTNMILYRSQLQESADAGALATATALAKTTGPASDDDIAKAKQLGKDFTSGQMGNYLTGDADAGSAIKAGTTVDVTPTTSGGTTTYTVDVSTSYDMPLNGMTRMLTFYSTEQWNTVTLAAKSTATSSYTPPTSSGNPGGSTPGSGSGTTTGTNTSQTANALSMYFVLDRSGSMDELTDTVNAQQPTKSETTTTSYTYSCPTAKNPKKTCTGSTTTTTQVPNYYTKMEALKIAAGNLTTQLNKADPNMQYVRTGADSFNNLAQTPTPLAWGTANVTKYVNALTSTGTTDSSGAFKAGYTALSAASEASIQLAKNGATLTKTIVFMTDGNNNVANADTTTRTYCDKARQAGIKVYTIALMAPEQGQALLKYCATTSSAYFDAQNAADLVNAFQQIGAAATGTDTSADSGSSGGKLGQVRLTK